jgi:hypothetical protein
MSLEASKVLIYSWTTESYCGNADPVHNTLPLEEAPFKLATARVIVPDHYPRI